MSNLNFNRLRKNIRNLKHHTINRYYVTPLFGKILSVKYVASVTLSKISRSYFRLML